MAEGLLSHTRSLPTVSSDVGETAAAEGTPQKTVLRFKRRIEDSPSKVLVMSYKRRKQEDVLDESVGSEVDGLFVPAKHELYTHVFHLAGTVTTDKVDSSLAETIKTALLDVNKTKVRLPDTKEDVRNRVIHRLKSNRAKEVVQKQSILNRFRVVCNKRGHSLLDNEIMNNDENSPPSETNAEKLETQRLFNLLDLVGEHEVPQVKKAKKGLDPREPGSVTCNGIPMIKEKIASETILASSSSSPATDIDDVSKFVYDVYVSNETVVEHQMHNKFVSVRHADHDYELDFDQDAEADEENRMDDDDDSNDEGNYKNEYPDTDDSDQATGGPNGSYDEDDDFSQNFGKVKLDGDELSSDDEADAIYSTEDDGADNGLGGIQSQYKGYLARLRHEQEMADEVVSSASDSD